MARLGIGTTSPTLSLEINGTSSGAPLAFNNRPLKTDAISATSALATRAVSTWTGRNQSGGNWWGPLCWSPELGLFVAVGENSGSVQISADGVNWTNRTPTDSNYAFRGVCWSAELGILVVSTSPYSAGNLNRFFTSTDGIIYTNRTIAADNAWNAVVWASGLGMFVVVASSGTGNRVMTSTDGVNWVARVTPEDNLWYDLAYSPELNLLVSVANSGTNRIMTSSDGVNWIARQAPGTVGWNGITWSPELGMFLAGGTSGTNPAMFSFDGITWTQISGTPTINKICWSAELGLFAAVNRANISTSSNGRTWTNYASGADYLNGIAWSPQLGIFAAQSNASNANGQRVFTSKDVGLSVPRPSPTRFNKIPIQNNFNSVINPSSGTVSVDVSLGRVYLGDVSASVTTWAFTNVSVINNRVTAVTVIIDGDTAQTYGDACTVNGSAISGGVKWVGGTTPTATNNFDFITFLIVRDSSGTVNVFGSAQTNYS